uniref:C-type lectin domain-containing protein n=1 Tax=Equus caballus TaxID=9796 RepID=A0A9L0TRX8_HORSE
MKCPLLLPLLLLGTVAARYLFFPENHDPHLDIRETHADLIQDLALTDEVIQSEGEEAEASTNQDTFEDEQAMESDQAALGEDFQCPREEETIELSGHPGCKTCRYRLVRTPRRFKQAQNVCMRCYQGNLVSIHSSSLNYCQVWIGGILRGWRWCRRFRWTDLSRWNFSYWASGQPRNGRGRCVALCTRGGHQRGNPCSRRLPFICSS